VSKISGQWLISGHFQDNCEISGQLGALLTSIRCHFTHCKTLPSLSLS